MFLIVVFVYFFLLFLLIVYVVIIKLYCFFFEENFCIKIENIFGFKRLNLDIFFFVKNSIYLNLLFFEILYIFDG